jgi:heme A synthase
MDFFTIATSALGLVLTAIGISVAAFALDEKRRAELVRFWKKWLTIGFVLLIFANSTFGLYLFFIGPPQIVRADILRLMLHSFNLLAIPGICFMTAMGKAMDARTSKRQELEEALATLKARMDALAPSVG